MDRIIGSFPKKHQMKKILHWKNVLTVSLLVLFLGTVANGVHHAVKPVPSCPAINRHK